MSKAGMIVALFAVLALVGGCKDDGPGLPFGAQPGGTNAQVSAAPSTETTTTTTTTTETTTTTTEPAVEPLSTAAIDRTFQVYMNGLANHDMAALRSGTCPRLRNTLKGFALNGYYVGKWEEQPYEVGPSAQYVTVQAKITQIDPGTGASAGTKTYSWYVERDADLNYWVCGFLS